MFYLFKLKRFLNLSNTIFFKLHFNNKVHQCLKLSLWIMTVEHFCQRKIPFGKKKRPQWNFEGEPRGWPTFNMLGAMLISYL